MRKIICSVVIVLLIFILAACNSAQTNLDNAVLFYYAHNDIVYGVESGVITSTFVNTDAASDDYITLLKLYFNGPTNYDCISPFPAGTTMEEFSFDNNKVQIVLSPHMATITDSELTVALACLTRTVLEMTSASTLQIEIMNNKIWGEDHVTFSLNSFEYYDDVEPVNMR